MKEKRPRLLSNAAAAQAASATAQNLKRVMRAYAQQTTRPLSTMSLTLLELSSLV